MILTAQRQKGIHPDVAVHRIIQADALSANRQQLFEHSLSISTFDIISFDYHGSPLLRVILLKPQRRRLIS